MSNLPLLDEHLRMLRLPTILANYHRVAGDDSEKIRFLQELVALEVDWRHENGVRARIAAAGFPGVKTIESFDFSLQAQPPKAKLLDLLDGRFIADKHQSIFSVQQASAKRTS